MKAKLIFSLIVFSFIARAQEIPRSKHDNMLWFGYYNNIVLKPRWAINSDIQGRTKDWHQNWSQALIRTGLSFKANDRVTITAGVAHFRFFLTNEVTRGEWRPWQELMINDKIGKVKLTYRFRFEQRFNQKVANNEPIDDYQFNYRIRYRIDLRVPLAKESDKNNWYFLVGDEVMINAGKGVLNYFDQNRIYAGLNYEISKKVSLQLQYMHINQLLSNGITLDNIDLIRFNIYHTISL